ncbi:MAG: peptidase domain-containing ABC transporter [Calothrix sp. FI2-JRJ7]|jgi:ATP-binding cassette subfamily B protein|nr:peptidase domain-containing ABC transporter [Calothrix sp. FI2-JRJ7]
MTIATSAFLEFVGKLEGFDQLPSESLTYLSQHIRPSRYRIGQKIVEKEKMPDCVTIIYEGKVRLLAYDARTRKQTTLKLLESGSIVGEASILREIACETAIASSEVTCLTLDAKEYLRLLSKYPAFALVSKNRCHLVEVFDILGTQKQVQANVDLNLKELAQKALKEAKVHYLSPGLNKVKQLDREFIWFVSSGEIKNFSPCSRLELENNPDKQDNKENNKQNIIEVQGKNASRLIGLRKSDLLVLDQSHLDYRVHDTKENPDEIEIPYVSKEIPLPESTTVRNKQKRKYPFVHGKGQLNSTIACFQMVSNHLEISFRQEIARRILTEQSKRQGTISFQLCAYVAELIGLKAQLIDIPSSQVTRVPTPALIRFGDSFAVLFEASEHVVVLGIPSQGIQHLKPSELLASLDDGLDSNRPSVVRVVLLAQTKATPQKRFGLGWFVPYLSRYRRVLIEVFLASFFVQLAALVNPLVVQIIIDQVITQNSTKTLHLFGGLLIVVALFEAILTTLRTYLFVDTTNRIDMSLGSEIIDHLLRLPLDYYQRRPVGELSTRINELENIRKFLTGTALTVGLDALFSVIYIIVMLFYSWQLTIVGLATIPVFIIFTFIFSPIVRKQLRNKAERNAETQSYLVEVISGIQTVKAQNIELRSRFSWQERYASYVAAGFDTIITSTIANSTSSFLNKLSSLAVLWAGAYLVLQGELTLGELIAFRIISSYVTSPILRLAQLWQSFQETALSLERLSDIIDTPQEAEQDRDNILLPSIRGAVKYENINFRFRPDRPLQLCNVSLNFQEGEFIGIVGQSGAGKSTLTKLLIRLYEPESGRISIDGYDISKVELYSLRRQIGFVPQDTLLFDGTIQENIALTNPDATTEEIIEAAKIAVAHDFIMDLPNGYNTRVGERGASLSGGQRQRIAIARSVIQRPKLLILDEATSALDYPTERQVCLNLAEAFKDSTVFFITHRLNTVKHANRIVVMDSGRVIEQGTHDELLAIEAQYFYLYNQQEVNL